MDPSTDWTGGCGPCSTQLWVTLHCETNADFQKKLKHHNRHWMPAWRVLIIFIHQNGREHIKKRKIQ